MPVSQRSLNRNEAEGRVSLALSPWLKSMLPAILRPGSSNGLRVRRFTVPPRPPSMISAEGFLYTSTPAISSAGTSSKPMPRPPLALNTSRPFSSPRTKVRPRIITPVPSAEKWSVSLRAAKPVTVTPLMRLSVSVTLRSGSAPMSCAVTESMICSASCFRSWARIRLPRRPLTSTVSSSTASGPPPEPGSWACTPPAASARATPSASAERCMRKDGYGRTVPARLARSWHFDIQLPLQRLLANRLGL